MRYPAWLFVLSLCSAMPASRALADGTKPSRPPVPRCEWQQLADAGVGLQAWVQRCDFGFRRIDFAFQGKSLAIRYSDGGAPEPVVDVIDLSPGESASAGMRRIFAAATDPAVAKRCVLTRYRSPGQPRGPAGVQRYTFVPNAAYARALKATAKRDEVPEPPCGDYGDAPDGIRYFETHADGAARRLLFVRVGQDTPLFDEATLRLLPAGRR